MSTDQTFTLPGGRTIGYAEYGSPGGKPVLFFQGTPSSRLVYPDEVISTRLNARIITADRPGFGLSTPHPDRTLLSWIDDLTHLLDHLGVDKFAVAGLSGGGPYIIAAAYALPDRVTTALSAGGMGPYESPGALGQMSAAKRMGFMIARRFPALVKPVIKQFANPLKDPEGYLKQGWDALCQSDKDVLSREDITAMIPISYAAALSQGFDGFAQEITLFAREWGIPFERITTPVHLWYGAHDTTAPPEMGEYLASRIPTSQYRLFPDDGHFLLFAHWEAILTLLLAA